MSWTSTEGSSIDWWLPLPPVRNDGSWILGRLNMVMWEVSPSAQSCDRDNCGDPGSFIIACALRSIWHDVMLSFRLTPVSLAALATNARIS
jgi:hypothetical protein